MPGILADAHFVQKTKENLRNFVKTTEKGEKQKEKIQIPIWEKANLTIQEAAVYFNIGEKKLREMSNNPKCKFALFVGNKCLIKRKSLEEYLKHTSYI